MAVTILPPRPTGAEQFGTGLGSGISQILGHLAQQKLQSLQQRNVAQNWENAGLPPQVANLIASSPEAVQKSLLDRLEGLSFGQQGVPSGQQPMGPQPMGQQPLRLGAGQQERRHRESLASQEKLAERKLSAQEQREANRAAAPILKDLYEGIKDARPAITVAKKALNILEKYPNKFPQGIIQRNWPTDLLNDPIVRQYDAIMNDYISKLSNAIKGRPTEYRIKLLERAKAYRGQPIETQKSILRDIVKELEYPQKVTLPLIGQIKKEFGDKYPLDLGVEIAKREAQRSDTKEEAESLVSQEAPVVKQLLDRIEKDPQLGNPANFEVGTIIKVAGNHKFQQKNNKWVYIGQEPSNGI